MNFFKEKPFIIPTLSGFLFLLLVFITNGYESFEKMILPIFAYLCFLTLMIYLKKKNDPEAFLHDERTQLRELNATRAALYVLLGGLALGTFFLPVDYSARMLATWILMSYPIIFAITMQVYKHHG